MSDMNINVTNFSLNKNPDMIWGMLEHDDTIGLRLDCGDAGVIFLTQEQAKEVIDFLQEMLTAAESLRAFQSTEAINE